MVNRLFFFGVWCFLMLSACQSENNEVLDKEKFTKLYLEMLMSENYYSLKNFDFDDNEALHQALDSTRSEILKYYKTDSSVFRRSIEYYSQDVDAMAEIMKNAESQIDTILAKIKI